MSYTFENDISNTYNCSRTLLTVTNDSDTAVLRVTATFTVSYDPVNGASLKFADQTMSEPAGIRPFGRQTIVFPVCVDKSLIPHPQTDADQVDAVPVRFRWQWERA